MVKNKYILMFVSLLCLYSVSALIECDTQVLEDDTPCLILVKYDGNCSKVVINFYDYQNIELSSRNMSAYNSFICNQTFDYETTGVYTYNLTINESGIINVVENKNNKYYLLVIALFSFAALLLMGYKLENQVFIILAGMLSCVMALNIFLNGFPNLTDEFIRNGIVIILAGIGFYLMVAPSIDYLENFGSISRRADDD